MQKRLIVLALVLFTAAPAWAQKKTDHWVTTWATAVVARPAPPAAGAPAPAGRGPAPAPLTLNNQTLRQIVHVSAGGSKVRVVLSNVFGTAKIDVGAAS